METEKERLNVKSGFSFAKDSTQAVEELYKQIYQPEMKGMIFFCSSRYDLDTMGKEINKRFPCPVIGCTTAGEITSNGYQVNSLIGTSLASVGLNIQVHPIKNLKQFTHSEAEPLKNRCLKELVLCEHFNPKKMFGLLLIDGLSMMEEHVVSLLYNHFGEIPIIGGSAGDDLEFKATKVYVDGNFNNDTAAFAIFETDLPFYLFRLQHFQPSEKKLVITEAEPSKRIVIEINGLPAAEEYARILGLNIADLNPYIFSTYPVMLKVGGEYYVRSIQKRNDDGSLIFYCAIDNGLVLTIANGVDMVKNLKENLSVVREKIPNLKLIIGCDCILRQLEAMEKGLQEEIAQTLREFPFVGFSTYGEQWDGIHVNQTLTGVAIGG